MSRRPQHVGRWSSRLKHDNPREASFAAEWARENDPSHRTMSTLEHLLYGCGHGNESPHSPACQAIPTLPIDNLSERDRVVAATVMQWLGSNVGFDFLDSALRACGYEIVMKKRVGPSNGGTE